MTSLVEKEKFTNNLQRKKLGKNDYNREPIFYCKQCLSLRIKSVPGMEDLDYCDECNSTNIAKTIIEKWESMYERRYGHKFLDK